MCALFGESRDISLFRNINRELLGNIINQQCIFYKYELAKTKTNIYGEASEGRYFKNPIIFNCLIKRNPQESPTSEVGVDFGRVIDFALLKDDLVDANLVPEIGDVIMYQEGYYEITNTISNQLFIGKNPDYSNEQNPLNPELSRFGYDVSIICQTTYVNADKLNINKNRI